MKRSRKSGATKQEVAKPEEVSQQQDWKLWRPQRHLALCGGVALLWVAWMACLITMIVLKASASPPGS